MLNKLLNYVLKIPIFCLIYIFAICLIIMVLSINDQICPSILSLWKGPTDVCFVIAVFYYELAGIGRITLLRLYGVSRPSS